MAFVKKKKQVVKAEPELEAPEPPPIQQEVRTIQRAVEVPSVATAWSVEEIPTQTQKVLYNQHTKETLDIYSALAELLNRTEE